MFRCGLRHDVAVCIHRPAGSCLLRDHEPLVGQGEEIGTMVDREKALCVTTEEDVRGPVYDEQQPTHGSRHKA